MAPETSASQQSDRRDLESFRPGYREHVQLLLFRQHVLFQLLRLFSIFSIRGVLLDQTLAF